MKIKYYIWRKVGGVRIEYMTNKPGETTRWELSKGSAHKFTFKQACDIIQAFERERSRFSSEVWGKEVVHGTKGS